MANRMNEEETTKRIERLEEEMDMIKLSLRASERFLEALKEMMERWYKQRKK